MSEWLPGRLEEAQERRMKEEERAKERLMKVEKQRQHLQSLKRELLHILTFLVKCNVSIFIPSLNVQVGLKKL